MFKILINRKAAALLSIFSGLYISVRVRRKAEVIPGNESPGNSVVKKEWIRVGWEGGLVYLLYGGNKLERKVMPTSLLLKVWHPTSCKKLRVRHVALWCECCNVLRWKVVCIWLGLYKKLR